MMTWMTNVSLFDSAEALALPQLALAQVESFALFNELMYSEPSEERGSAPAPLKMMWQGYEVALAAYSVATATILVKHGVTAAGSPLALTQSVRDLRQSGELAELVLPPWFEDTDVLRSHRSNLMRRWPEVYSWNRTKPDMPYLWPVVDDNGGYELRLSKYDRNLLANGERSLPPTIMERITNA
jgi:hypothetical protein